MRGGIPVCGRWQVEDACVGSGGGRFRVNGERVIIGSSRWQVGGECVDVGGGCCGFKEEPISDDCWCGGSCRLGLVARRWVVLILEFPFVAIKSYVVLNN